MIRLILTTILSTLLLHSAFAQKKNVPIKNTDTIAAIQSEIQKADSLAGSHNSPLNNVGFQSDLYQSNIFFYAFNSENNWKLLIKEDTSFTFMLNNDTIVFQYAKHSQAQDASIVRYYSKTLLNSNKKQDTTKKNITITIREQRYKGDKSAVYYPLSVEVAIGDQVSKSSAYYSGGGFYIVNPVLNDIWVLDSLNKKPVQKELFPDGLPRLEFYIDGGRLSGFGGCNELTGSYYLIQHQIHFNPPATTLKLCKNMAGETAFLPLLNNKRYTYSIKNMRLKLSGRDGTLLIFKKVD